MRFTPEEIEMSHRLKSAGLLWVPTVGHYVWDAEPLIEAPSPFHDRVFFILDLKHFLRRSTTIERLAESMVWLPTWEQTREQLAKMGVPTSRIVMALQQSSAFEKHSERLVMMRLIEEKLLQSK